MKNEGISINFTFSLTQILEIPNSTLITGIIIFIVFSKCFGVYYHKIVENEKKKRIIPKIIFIGVKLHPEPILNTFTLDPEQYTSSFSQPNSIS